MTSFFVVIIIINFFNYNLINYYFKDFIILSLIYLIYLLFLNYFIYNFII